MTDRAESRGLKQVFGDATHALSEILANQGMPGSGGKGSGGSGGGGDAGAAAPKSFADVAHEIAEGFKKAIYPA